MRVYHSTCPCKGCTYRELGCHSNCKNPEKTYDEWKKDSTEKVQPQFFMTKAAIRAARNKIKK